MITNISLDKIQPNPWQTRMAIPDGDYIQELALDIAANGLLQIPVGRQLPDGTIQLAFGHNRLAAYRFLDSEIDDKWPVKTDWANVLACNLENVQTVEVPEDDYCPDEKENENV